MEVTIIAALIGALGAILAAVLAVLLNKQKATPSEPVPDPHYIGVNKASLKVLISADFHSVTISSSEANKRKHIATLLQEKLNSNGYHTVSLCGTTNAVSTRIETFAVPKEHVSEIQGVVADFLQLYGIVPVTTQLPPTSLSPNHGPLVGIELERDFDKAVSENV